MREAAAREASNATAQEAAGAAAAGPSSGGGGAGAEEGAVDAHENTVEGKRAADDVPRLSVAMLPPDVLALVDRLTGADRAVYRAAATRLVRELRAAAADAATPLLCPAALATLVDRTRYVEGLAADLLRPEG